MEKLKILLSEITSKQPAFYLKLYIASLFLFAAAYSANSEDFHHSTIPYERGFGLQSDELVEYLKAEFKSAMTEINSYPKCIEIKKYVPDSVEILWWGAGDMERISSTNNYMELFSFHLYYYVEINGVEKRETSKITLNGISHLQSGEFNGTLIFPVLESENSKCFTGDSITGQVLANSTNWDKPFPRYASLINLASKEYQEGIPKDGMKFGSVMLLSSEDRKIIRGYYRLYVDGNPSAMDNIFENYMRMLYLSAVTITTLGYGDIVPTSLFNRFLVGLEAFVGVVIAGLFLTSLSKRVD